VVHGRHDGAGVYESFTYVACKQDAMIVSATESINEHIWCGMTRCT
jgi:hypothetical protein